MNNEEEIELMIKEKNLNAPRITPDDIDENIETIHYHVVPNTTLILCVLVLKNDFTVSGESAAASKENFDEEIGRKIAFDNAREKIWPLMGYMLKQKLYEDNLK